MFIGQLVWVHTRSCAHGQIIFLLKVAQFVNYTLVVLFNDISEFRFQDFREVM